MSETVNILGISGRRSAGKDTLCNFVHGAYMTALGLVDYYSISEKGKLLVPSTLPNGEIQQGIFDLDKANYDDKFMAYCLEKIWGYVRKLALADPLKILCWKYLNIAPELLWGTDEDKATPTQFYWRDFPVKIFRNGSPDDRMTIRDILQYVGTNVFRRMYPDIWVDMTLGAAKRCGSRLVIIPDVRFINEVKKIQEAGGKVIRLKRNIHGNDIHESELELDNYMDFNLVVDNSDMEIGRTAKIVWETLEGWGFVEVQIQEDEPLS